MRHFAAAHGFPAGPAVVAAVVLSFCAATLVAAENSAPYEATITAPGAPVLSGPGDSFYPTDTLAEGDVVEVYRDEPGGWLGIRPPADSFSWLFGRHVKLLAGGLAQVDKDDIASRIGSRLGDQRNAVQVRLKKGEVVEIIGEQTVEGQTWYKIAPPSGEFRWVHARYVASANQSSPHEPLKQLPPPVVTVPVTADPAVPQAPQIVLAADSEPAHDDSWRPAPAAPGSASAETPLVDARATADVSTADVSTASEPLGRASTASAPSNTGPVAALPSQQPAGSASDAMQRQLTELEVRLSQMVAEPPANWQIDPLEREAEQLLAQAPSVEDRAAVQTTLAKVDRFAVIARRYRQSGPRSTPLPALGTQPTTGPTASAAPAGATAITPLPGPPASFGSQLPITPLPAAAPGVVGPDGQRYDAIGILRPVVSKRPGAPQFALLNERGQVVSFVTPTPDTNLQPYVGHRVGVIGMRGYIPEFQRAHVTAGRVAPLSEQLLR